MSDPLFAVENLEKHFERNTGLINRILSSPEYVQAVDGVSFTLDSNESMAIVGESGCGKSTLFLTLIGLHDRDGGSIQFKGTPLSSFSKNDWKQYRKSVRVIFQDPYNSLDPKMTVYQSLTEPLKIHRMDNKRQRVLEMLERVELNPPENYIDRHPRELSGGERQRVSIARALIVEPEVILADEPVSMLDVSTQAALLNLLDGLVKDFGASLIYISHDLSTVSYISQRINVMYLGRFVESAPTTKLLGDPKHPYSKELIKAIPIPDPEFNREHTQLSGAPREPVDLGEGCRFLDRCPEAMEICEKSPIPMEVEPGRHTECHLYYDHEALTSEELTAEVRQ